ncbi:hypothetical protein ACLQ28_06080 [Micromonospora sp. DT201]|uniref:hypothetical protein n=1 Tax=Micromonospora sp. DT201 TaxID=3393442 RepID=UPI003CFAAB08
MSRDLIRRWYSPAEVAVLLGFGLPMIKMKFATGELRRWTGGGGYCRTSLLYEPRAQLKQPCKRPLTCVRVGRQGLEP